MPTSTLDLSQRVALVTGASRGIGRAIALSLAAAGAAVAVNYRQRESEADEVVARIASAGGRAIAVRADVSVAHEVEAMIDAVQSGLGAIDVLVNNAGTGLIRDIDELTEAEFDRTLAVNLKSAFLCTQAVLPGMRARRWGRIVNISSAAARGGGLVGVHYNASKAGLEGLTRGYAARLGREGITVNAVAPALIDTEMVAPLKAANVVERMPVGRLGEPDEVAQAVLTVVGNAFITGQTIAVNGGVTFI
ncbi:3-oxoacyl-[acyl-carrier protein] reductase [Paraburkholderia unamae]|uniref:SDR family oxidoreductase n=1 Tax=Paraburkholderia unamae TaxID=219649 RepID=UPI000DC2433B|nr:SDR family NAD(P)-dependent oxidoreductase [Paraburkholderia unamae]RAR57836.1 3-oxoacyl-[acyl-carrier protein] reductase [Paraburkholderia unamae]